MSSDRPRPQATRATKRITVKVGTSLVTATLVSGCGLFFPTNPGPDSGFEPEPQETDSGTAETDGTETDGTETAGTETAGTETAGTETD